MPAARLLLAACLLAAAGGARGDGGVGEKITDEAAGGPQPVAQLTLTMTDGSGKQSPVIATVMAEEDAAAAAVRFCFDKGLLQPRQVLDITGYLKSALEGKEHEPDGIEFLRTAGAYSRRAAESSKEESYAEAAAGVPPPPQWRVGFAVSALAPGTMRCPVAAPRLTTHLRTQTWCAHSTARGSTRRQKRRLSGNCPRHFET